MLACAFSAAILACSPQVTAPSSTTQVLTTSAPTSAPTTATATVVATLPPTPTRPPAPTAFHFGSGQRTIGVDLQAGTYRTRAAAPGCYWARLSGFGGTVQEILANENTNGPAVITIAASDKGFMSTRCSEWSADLSAVTKAQTDPFPAEGTFIVGTDIAPGTWQSSGGTGCYWARMQAFTGGVADLIANANVDGPVSVTIAPTDKGFKSTRCGTWTKIG
jgi:hypothetical protein